MTITYLYIFNMINVIEVIKKLVSSTIRTRKRHELSYVETFLIQIFLT